MNMSVVCLIDEIISILVLIVSLKIAFIVFLEINNGVYR